MSLITTHVLDTTTGTPARGIAVKLVGSEGAPLGSGTTDADGRIADLGPEKLPAGAYRLVFATAEYFASREVAHFFPEVTLTFAVDASAEHYHVPLLLSPFGYSTYRGS
ncbi:hydroxyisourate hydrolase [Nesterenkonia lutea]|uniref:5-hydroxyisourate hydrolase n=1 Tax=Nesterenkonia lutea TaxID=272919 RepID=A0ABR9JFH6_9MICC|nr:hydroxyisourate hydrolase [Nesterenkonia lutea]MBE1524684.1 5-hydroxyisourate hydrolase [Nesterenkonia lutea]